MSMKAEIRNKLRQLAFPETTTLTSPPVVKKASVVTRSKSGNLVLYHMGLQRHECLKVEHGVAEACTISVQKQRILLYTYQLLLHIS